MEIRFERIKRFIEENKYSVIFWIIMFVAGFALAIYFFRPNITIVPAR